MLRHIRLYCRPDAAQEPLCSRRSHRDSLRTLEICNTSRLNAHYVILSKVLLRDSLNMQQDLNPMSEL